MLKSLELFGFKSFADRTLFEFAPGITCVVGPNGSGKSNVVDAIKWILGDQSAKSLRGKDMQDVIFNGSAGRRGSGFAEATLAFDNADGLLPIESREVRIGRRLYQSGDSEYLLNGAPVRLKDIRDLFMGTGAGTAAYSIIEQGRVDQILQANPVTRRLVFEEAAGISKLKARRIDAERRLERVAQNLLRLTDLVDQADSQLAATRSQAAKAARYREISAELREAWTGLAADDARLLTSQLETAQQALEELRSSDEELRLQVEAAEQARRAIDDELGAVEDQRRRCERAASRRRETIAVQHSTQAHQRQRLVEFEEEISRLRQERWRLNHQLEVAAVELDATARRLDAFTSQVAESQTSLRRRASEAEDLAQAIASRRGAISVSRTALSEQQRRRQALLERMAALDSETESWRRQAADATTRFREIESELEAAHAERRQRQSELDDAEAAWQSRQADQRDGETEQARLHRQLGDVETQLRRMRERRSAAEARLTLLEELEQRQEGIAIGVRDILHRAETAHFPPWNRVLGLVRDLIEAPIALAPILDAALGERAQWVVITQLDPLLDYLDRGAAPIEGRVGFVALNDAGAPADPPGLPAENWTHEPGVYGRADRLVTERPAAQGLAARVLAATWIVESLEVARRLAPRSSSNTRFVTLQGEVLTAEGQLAVGALPHESSIISRRSELRQLKNEVQQLLRSLEDTEQRRAILQDALASQSDELDELASVLKHLSQAAASSTARLEAATRNVERAEKDHAQQADLVERLQLQSHEISEERAARALELESLSALVEKTSTAIHLEESQLREIDEAFSEIDRRMKAEQLELAKHEERLAGLHEGQQRLTADQAARQARRDGLRDRIEQVEQAARQARLALLRAESTAASEALLLQAATGELRSLRRLSEALRSRRKEFASEEDQVRRRQRELAERQRTLDIEAQKHQMQLQALAERIQEEFQATLESLVEAGLSAYADYCDRLSSEGEPPAFAEVRPELEAVVDRLRRKLKSMGHVATDALDSLEELEQRAATLNAQFNDLQEAKTVLEEIIRRINTESQRVFLETFTVIREHFRELFRKLFGGGDADIVLEDPNDVLECGIDIVARPPGKELRSISLLSGGEKTMTAVGLLFAMFKSKPSPYCILDEVDAALDEANVDRYVTVLKEFVSMTQFVVITHRKRTMTAADVLYGVTMEQAGVSKRMAVKFEDVRDNGEIRTAA